MKNLKTRSRPFFGPCSFLYTFWNLFRDTVRPFNVVLYLVTLEREVTVQVAYSEKKGCFFNFDATLVGVVFVLHVCFMIVNTNTKYSSYLKQLRIGKV